MLSVLVLTKNEEDVIADCLESVKDIADEILVIDAKSDDRTPEIAQHLGAKVISHEFQDFASQRNFAFSKAKGDWVLYLDADERATSEFKTALQKILQHHREENGIGGYYIQRKTFFYGKDWGLTDRVQRLFLRKQFIEWKGIVHETPKIKGSFGEISEPILHYTHRNLSQMLAKTNEWSEYEADLRFKSHHPKMTVLRFIRVMATGFFKSYFQENGYKNGTEGFIEATYQAFSMFVTYAKLWEKQNNHD